MAKSIQSYKKWWKSRTVWLNIMASIAFTIEISFGFPIPLEIQVYIVAVLNLILRFNTEEAIKG